MSNLEAQYRFLAELKKIDERAHLVERDTERVPDEIKKQEEALSSRRQALDTAKAQATECEKKLRSAERELKEKEDSLFKAEGKMMEVKTNEEYQAALKENQVQKQAKGLLEDRVLQILNEVEEQKRVLGEIEREFRGYEQTILQEKTKLSQEHQELLKTLEGLLRQRQSFVSQLSPDVAGTYQKIVANGKGTAIAFVEQGRCLACNIQVRPQIYNEVLGYKTFHRCSNCGRILITSPRAGAGAANEDLQAK